MTLTGRLNAIVLGFIPVIAVAALLLSLPRFLEGMLALPGDAAIYDLQSGVGTQATVDTLVESRERTLRVIDRGRYHSQLSAALELRSRSQQGEERKATLERAVLEAKRGVAEAPGDATAWYHLAKASFENDGPNPLAVNAALSSIAVGPYETELLAPRLDILFASRSYLGHSSDDMIDGQVRVAWKRSLYEMIRIIRRNGAADIVRRGLEREPSIAENFDQAVGNPNIQ